MFVLTLHQHTGSVCVGSKGRKRECMEMNGEERGRKGGGRGAAQFETTVL